MERLIKKIREILRIFLPAEVGNWCHRFVFSKHSNRCEIFKKASTHDFFKLYCTNWPRTVNEANSL